MKKKPFIGFYGYWVVLTYLAVVAAVTGICFALLGAVNAAVVCMIIAGICDTFDGTVARTAKRTDTEKAFGIQIDSLADVISFGILPATIGFAIYQKWGVHTTFHTLITVVIMAGFVLAGLIRLAYFNVTEEEMQARGEKRTYYEGLPITMSSLLLSVSYAVFGGMEQLISPIYTALLAIIGTAFVLRFRLPKLKLRDAVILGFAGLGIIILALVLRGVIG